MKLRNKETGEIWDISKVLLNDYPSYDSLEHINEDFEDYEEPKSWWYIDCNGEVFRGENADKEHTEEHKSIGNYYTSSEEAEKTVEKLKAWKRLKDKGFKIKGWKFTPDMKQIQGNYVKIEAEIPQILINEKDLDLLFGGEE